MTLHLAKEYINVMEILVSEEVEKQLKKCPTTMLPYIRKTDLETYALNRLPCLYASSQEGLERQTYIGRKKYRSQVKIAVMQAIAAVQRDPIRKSTPLLSPEELEYQNILIQALESIPNHSHLRQTVVRALRQAVAAENSSRETTANRSISVTKNDSITVSRTASRSSKHSPKHAWTAQTYLS
ncbi:late competence development ComFB family protein [Baaleninema sp.]|uniref:late competence development ComFB family protein n=1 Tax=Baaleninema sp. TaxID=3101197 RepID=UPI003CFF4CA0